MIVSGRAKEEIARKAVSIIAIIIVTTTKQTAAAQEGS
jgi:hypothetical protein